MNFYLRAFLVFFRIGLFTIGGGYAMVPLIEADLVDKRKWVKKEDFLDLMALAQTVPGIFAVNIAIFIGYKLKGFWGAFWMALGTILPSFLISRKYKTSVVVSVLTNQVDSSRRSIY